MYDNEIYSGAGAGSNTSGAYSGNGNNGNGNNGNESGNNGNESGNNGNGGNENFGNANYGNGGNGSFGNANTGNDTSINGSGATANSYAGQGSKDENYYAGTEHQGYNTYSIGENSSQPDPGRKKKEPRTKKPNGFFRKSLLSTSLGLFFGLFAGLGFYAVQQTSGLMQQPVGSGSTEVQKEGNSGDSGTPETDSGIKLTDTSDIRVVSSDVSDVVDEVMPAMVSIDNNFTEEGVDIFGQNYSQDLSASGTGIIVAESDTELLIVTNHHVVADASTLDVAFIDGSTAQASVKGTDSDMDLAVIAIPLESLSEETKNVIAVAALGDSDSLKMGEPVIAIGNALGYGQSVTGGYVSALEREIPLEDGSTGKFIQTDAAINPGNSGGALLNVNGEVVGINSNKIGGNEIEGMGYAIPISAAKPIIADLMLKQTRTKVEEDQMGYLGITLQTITDQISAMLNMPEGIYVTGVEEGSAALQAGILPGDIITKFEGEKISSYEDLQRVMQYYGAGTSVSITVKRPQNGEYTELELTVTLGSRASGIE